MKNIVTILTKERNKIAAQLSGLDSAIKALSNGSGSSRTGRRKLSEAGRMAISRAAKKRWAKLKASKK